MATTKEQEQLILEFCENTGSDKQWAYGVLSRNKWNMPSSYREIEQMLINSNRAEQQTKGHAQSEHHSCLNVKPSHKPEDQQVVSEMCLRPSSGGMVEGMASAVIFDPQTEQSQISTMCRNSTFDPLLQGMQELRVALPHIQASTERIIPIYMEGRGVESPHSVAKTVSSYPEQHLARPGHRTILNEKAMTSQPNAQPMDAEVDGKKESISPAAGSESTTSSQNSVSTCELYPKLKRGFSNILENESLVSDARSSVLHDIQENSHDHMYVQSFMLPSITSFPENFQAFLEKELMETSTLISLEQAGRLNWWAEIGVCQRLIPLATTGDGNCLLHAASLAMWGIHDRQLILRNALHSLLTKKPVCDNLHRRWRWQQDIINRQSGLVLSEAEWNEEWNNILRLASPSPRALPDKSRTNNNSCCDSPITRNVSDSEPVVYESLEEFHVFVLAHVLQRPIIVVADVILKDSNGEDLAPIPFGGIYLPFECSSAKCYRSPLLLTYDAAHFSALVPMASSIYTGLGQNLPLAIPVVDPSMNLLPLHFCHDPGKGFDWTQHHKKPLEISLQDQLNLLMHFMDVKQLPVLSDELYLSDISAKTNIPSNTIHQQYTCDSHFSEEVPLIVSLKGKERKKDGKPSTVAKQFGSLGKSVGKKLRDIGNNIAPSKTSAKGGLGTDACDRGPEQQTMTVGTGLANSTTLITMLATSTRNKDGNSIWCAVLSESHSEAQEEMVRNYLKDARKRFERDCEQKAQRREESQSRIALCPTANIGLGGKPSSTLHEDNGIKFSYPSEKKSFSVAAHTQTLGQFSYNTFPGRAKGLNPNGGSAANDDRVYQCGKSKFYTLHAETKPESDTSKGLLVPLHSMNRQQSLSAGNVAVILPRARSPSPDYDNMMEQGVTGMFGNPSNKCANKDCPFYGSKETCFLCSKCYRQFLQPNGNKNSKM